MREKLVFEYMDGMMPMEQFCLQLFYNIIEATYDENKKMLGGREYTFPKFVNMMTANRIVSRVMKYDAFNKVAGDYHDFDDEIIDAYWSTDADMDKPYMFVIPLIYAAYATTMGDQDNAEMFRVLYNRIFHNYQTVKEKQLYKF